MKRRNLVVCSLAWGGACAVVMLAGGCGKTASRPVNAVSRPAQRGADAGEMQRLRSEVANLKRQLVDVQLAAVEELGAKVLRDKDKNIVGLDFSRVPVKGQLYRLAGFPDLRQLKLNESGATDRDLKFPLRLKKLQTLEL